MHCETVKPWLAVPAHTDLLYLVHLGASEKQTPSHQRGFHLLTLLHGQSDLKLQSHSPVTPLLGVGRGNGGSDLKTLKRQVEGVLCGDLLVSSGDVNHQGPQGEL